VNMTLREIFERYGPALSVAVVIALLVVLMPGNADEGGDVSATGDVGSSGAFDTGADTGAAGPTDGGSTAEPGALDAPTDGGPGGVSPSGGEGGATTGGNGGQGAPGAEAAPPPPPANTTCREDGAMPAFSHYSPRCVPVFAGDNGGATSQGVTADTIKVVYYFPNTSAATQATLQAIGADDPRPQSKDVAATLARYFNTHHETYGRAVELTFFESKADTDDDAALKADAVHIATQIKPFAVMGAPEVAATELAAREIICMCTASEPRGYYQQTAPHVFGTLPDAEEFFEHTAEYIGKRLAGRPAKWAGELPPTMRTTDRKFGLIYLEGTGSRIDPRVKQAVGHYERELAKYGVKLARKVSYTLDTARGQELSTNIVSQLKAAGVSNVACFCDPLMPIFFTKAATQQQWFPEWLLVGSLLTDTTFFGRTYDPAQWTHAFGISPLYVFWENIMTSTGAREFHHMRPDAQPGDEGTQINVREAPFAILFAGIHGAGANLTAQTFAQALFDFGPEGGVPSAPLYDFSPQSYTAYSDFTEVFWDATGRGKDETGKEGVGVLLKVAGGKRYRLGQWPRSEPKVFDRNGAVFTSDRGANFDHDADGHRHAPAERCRSCRG